MGRAFRRWSKSEDLPKLISLKLSGNKAEDANEKSINFAYLFGVFQTFRFLVFQFIFNYFIFCELFGNIQLVRRWIVFALWEFLGDFFFWICIIFFCSVQAQESKSKNTVNNRADSLIIREKSITDIVDIVVVGKKIEKRLFLPRWWHLNYWTS